MKKTLFTGFVVGISAVALNASATSIIMQGDYVRTAVSDNGSLGFGLGAAPGIEHDPAGTGIFGGVDYLIPGAPWELFSISTTQTGLLQNNNAYSTPGIATTSGPAGPSSSTYDNHVYWAGEYTDYFTISNDTFFNDGDERISISTKITALTNLENLAFLRAIDPDQDAYITDGTNHTVNGRGFDANNDGDYDDAGDLAPEDWVHAEGPYTSLTLGLYSNSAVPHNTGVTAWSTDPSFYLSGTDIGDGDRTIGIAFDIGTLLTGQSVTLDYAYVMGDSLETVDIPDAPAPIPEPGTLVLFGSGLVGLSGAARRRLKK